MLREQEESEEELASEEEIIDTNVRNEYISQENASHVNILAGREYQDGSTGGIRLYSQAEKKPKPSEQKEGHQNRGTVDRIKNLKDRINKDKSSQDEGEGSSKLSKFMIDHEEHSSYPEVEKVSKLLKDFKPEELIQKATTKEKLQSFLLRVKAVTPLFVSLFMIYLISGVYIFTY